MLVTSLFLLLLSLPFSFLWYTALFWCEGCIFSQHNNHLVYIFHPPGSFTETLLIIRKGTGRLHGLSFSPPASGLLETERLREQTGMSFRSPWLIKPGTPPWTGQHGRGPHCGRKVTLTPTEYFISLGETKQKSQDLSTEKKCRLADRHPLLPAVLISFWKLLQMFFYIPLIIGPFPSPQILFSLFPCHLSL